MTEKREEKSKDETTDEGPTEAEAIEEQEVVHYDPETGRVLAEGEERIDPEVLAKENEEALEAQAEKDAG